MTRLPLPILAIASAIVVIACSSAGAPNPSTASLDGHTYISTGIEGAELVPGTQVTLTFTNGNLNARAGCNIMGGTYAIDGDRLVTTQMSMTEMGCDEARARQDEWLARFLGGVNFTLEGDTLTLTDGTIEVTLLDEEVATPDQPLEGTRWVLDGIVSGEGPSGSVSSVPAGVTAAIRIAGGRVDVEAGCNMGGGSVEVAPDTLTFGPIALTKMACEAGPMSVETAVVSVLSGVAAYTIDADVLTLDAGEAGLIFRAVS
jgi:heat shock protein HslJ